MTALTVEADRAVTGGIHRRQLSAASANPFAGSALSFNADGYVHELVSGEKFAGFCVQTIQTKNMAAADGSRFIETIAGAFVATLPITVAVADIGRRVYATDDNAFTFTDNGASTFIGRVIGQDNTSRAIVLCQTEEILDSHRYSLPGAGAALSASSDRTLLGGLTIKAGMLRLGSRIRIRAQAIITASNSSDTILLDIGVGSTVILAATAIDAVNSMIGFFDLDIIIRTIGQSGTMVAAGHYVKTLAAVDTAVTKPAILASTAVDTTGDLVVGLYGTWSTTSASNSCRADVVDIDVTL